MIGAVAAAHPVLGQLLPLARESRRLFQIALPWLPPSLAPAVGPGKWDGATWTLLAHSGAVAAKLQQIRPDLEAALRAQGVQLSAIQIKVQGLQP
ncbi:MAG: hypothetical protein KGJ44_04815 [Betaproteobacteria bacterium]|nr:hypothetical protein [Betaproteobacteria bacterium]